MKKSDKKIHFDIPMTKENAWLFKMNCDLEEGETDLEEEYKNDGESDGSTDPE